MRKETIHDVYIATDSGVRDFALWNIFWLRVCVGVYSSLHLVIQNCGGSDVSNWISYWIPMRLLDPCSLYSPTRLFL